MGLSSDDGKQIRRNEVAGSSAAVLVEETPVKPRTRKRVCPLWSFVYTMPCNTIQSAAMLTVLLPSPLLYAGATHLHANCSEDVDSGLFKARVRRTSMQDKAVSFFSAHHKTP